jgi:hypothetical protein
MLWQPPTVNRLIWPYVVPLRDEAIELLLFERGDQVDLAVGRLRVWDEFDGVVLCSLLWQGVEGLLVEDVPEVCSCRVPSKRALTRYCSSCLLYFGLSSYIWLDFSVL